LRFSEAFGVEPDGDWFDPLLTVDTQLFIDPFRIFVDTEPEWTHAHDRLIDFFNDVLSLVAKSGFKPSSAHWRKAERLLLFPEPREFGLGYARASTSGLGSGAGLRDLMLKGAVAGIKAGLEHFDHFEEMTLLQDGIGADRIGDMVGNVLKAEFADYTQRLAMDLGVAMAKVKLRHAAWSQHFQRWEDNYVDLPIVPGTNRGVLLVPKRFLRELPSVDPYEFWSWAWANENEAIRDDFNYEVASNVDAPTIARLARRHPDVAKKYMQHLESNPKDAYDVDADPALNVKWYEYGEDIAHRVGEGPPSSPRGFAEWVSTVVETFGRYVEDQGGWKLLWKTPIYPVSEDKVQALFRGTVLHYCRANDVDLTGESNAGRGPVDFKFSQGWERRAVVEIKLTNNTRFWHGLTRQLPQYMRSEEIHVGWFLPVSFRNLDFSEERVSMVREAAKATSDRLGIEIRTRMVDARPKPSASML
jgi:hypothetical protein